jgi:hypothetical protein
LETAVFQGLIPTLFGGTKVWEKEQSAIGECFTVNYVRPIFRHTRKQVISRATRREPYLWPQLLTAFSRETSTWVHPKRTPLNCDNDRI